MVRLAGDKDGSKEPQTTEGKTNDILNLISKLKQGDNVRSSGWRPTDDSRNRGGNDKQGQFQGQGRGRGRGQYQGRGQSSGRGQGQFRGGYNGGNNNDNGLANNGGNRRGSFRGSRGGRGGSGGYRDRNNNNNDNQYGGFSKRDQDEDDFGSLGEEDLQLLGEFEALSQKGKKVTLTEKKDEIELTIGNDVAYDPALLRDAVKKVEALGAKVISSYEMPEIVVPPRIVDYTARLVTKTEAMRKDFQGITPAPEDLKDFSTRLENFVSKPHQTDKVRVIEHFGIREPALETLTAAVFNAIDPATNGLASDGLSDFLPKEVEDSLITEERRLQNQKDDAECVKLLNFMVKELSRSFNPFTVGYDDRINGLELIEELSLVLDQRLKRRQKHEILRQRSRQKRAEKHIAAGLPAVMAKPSPVPFPRCDKSTLRNGFFTIQDLYADAWEYFCDNSSYKKYQYSITDGDREHFRAVLKLHCSGLYHNPTIPYKSKRKWLQTLTKFYVRATVFQNFFNAESKKVETVTESSEDSSQYHSEDWYEDEEDAEDLGDGDELQSL